MAPVRFCSAGRSRRCRGGGQPPALFQSSAKIPRSSRSGSSWCCSTARRSASSSNGRASARRPSCTSSFPIRIRAIIQSAFFSTHAAKCGSASSPRPSAASACAKLKRNNSLPGCRSTNPANCSTRDATAQIASTKTTTPVALSGPPRRTARLTISVIASRGLSGRPSIAPSSSSETMRVIPSVQNK